MLILCFEAVGRLRKLVLRLLYLYVQGVSCGYGQYCVFRNAYTQNSGFLCLLFWWWLFVIVCIIVRVLRYGYVYFYAVHLFSVLYAYVYWCEGLYSLLSCVIVDSIVIVSESDCFIDVITYTGYFAYGLRNYRSVWLIAWVFDLNSHAFLIYLFVVFRALLQELSLMPVLGMLLIAIVGYLVHVLSIECFAVANIKHIVSYFGLGGGNMGTLVSMQSINGGRIIPGLLANDCIGVNGVFEFCLLDGPECVCLRRLNFTLVVCALCILVAVMVMFVVFRRETETLVVHRDCDRLVVFNGGTSLLYFSLLKFLYRMRWFIALVIVLLPVCGLNFILCTIYVNYIHTLFVTVCEVVLLFAYSDIHIYLDDCYVVARYLMFYDMLYQVIFSVVIDYLHSIKAFFLAGLIEVCFVRMCDTLEFDDRFATFNVPSKVCGHCLCLFRLDTGGFVNMVGFILFVGTLVRCAFCGWFISSFCMLLFYLRRWIVVCIKFLTASSVCDFFDTAVVTVAQRIFGFEWNRLDNLY
eukprot:gene3324-2306_t